MSEIDVLVGVIVVACVAIFTSMWISIEKVADRLKREERIRKIQECKREEDEQ